MSPLEKRFLPICTLLLIGIVFLFDLQRGTQWLLSLWIITTALLYFVARHLQFFIEISVVKNKARRAQLFAASTRPAEVVMLGDSITHEGLWHEYFPESSPLNRGIGGDTTRDILNRLPAVYPLQPRRLFLLIGINDLNMGREREQTLADYSKILDELRRNLPSTTVYVQSVLPVSNHWKLARNADVLALNVQIQAQARQRDLTFIDLHPRFCDGHGELRAELSNDGIHLGPEGYALWCEQLRPFLP